MLTSGYIALGDDLSRIEPAGWEGVLKLGRDMNRKVGWKGGVE